MPNRILKESICTSDSIEGLNWFEEVLFYRLIVSCDDFGRFDGRAAVIRGRLFPLKSVTNKQVSEAVRALATAGIVMPYEVDGKPYLQLVNWDSHQQIRAQKSKYPAPRDGVAAAVDLCEMNNCNQLQSNDINCNQMISNDIKCSRNPIQSESNPNPNTKCANERFEQLWELYPNKRGKGKVSDAQKRKLYEIPFEEMKRAIDRYKAGLAREEWRKAQNGSTFFNSGYIDYLDENYKEYAAPGDAQNSYDYAALEKSALQKQMQMGGAAP